MMAPLQRRALLCLIIGLAFAGALVVVLILEGDINAFNEDGYLRWITYAALVAAPLSYLILIDLTLKKPTEMDERDRLIILKSSRVQWLALIFSMLAWMIALSEIYRSEGSVPIVFLDLIMISMLIISTLAQTLGILIGYWREG